MNSILRMRQSAFTVVELIIVVIVIGLLVTMATVGYGAWRDNVARAEVESDLRNVYAAMEDARNWSEGYPDIDAGAPFDGDNVKTKPIFTQSKDVVLTFFAGGRTAFCVDGTSRVRPNIRMFVSTLDGSKEPQIGSCIAGTEPVPTIPTNPSPPSAPNAPTLAAAQAGTDIEAVASGEACPFGTNIRYSFRERIGGGSYSMWTAWQDSQSYVRSGNTNGTTYWFQAKARCDHPTVEGAESPESNEVSVTYVEPVGPPAAPAPSTLTITLSRSGQFVVATATNAFCATGSIQYRFDTQNEHPYLGTQPWEEGTWTSHNAHYSNAVSMGPNGTRNFRVTPRCTNGTLHVVGATSPVVSYTRGSGWSTGLPGW